MSETDIKRAITETLEKLGYIVTRTAAGGYRGRTKGCAKGTADVHVVSKRGRSCWLEVKTDTGETTEEQEIFLSKVRASNAFAQVVRSPREAVEAMREADMGYQERFRSTWAHRAG